MGNLMRQHLLTALLCLAIPATAGAQSLARGKYIVEGTSMCNDCHTPRDDKGQLILSKALQGAPLGVQPIHPMPWADTAPSIAGLPANYTPGATGDIPANRQTARTAPRRARPCRRIVFPTRTLCR